MGNFISAITDNNKTNMDTRSQANLNGEPFRTFKFSTDNFQPRHQAIKIYQKSLAGDILIYGNEQYGTWGEQKWGDGVSLDLVWDSDLTQWDTHNWEEDQYVFILGSPTFGILGSSKLGQTSYPFVLLRVVPPQNRFIEPLLGTEFIDTDETTATLNLQEVVF